MLSSLYLVAHTMWKELNMPILHLNVLTFYK